MTVSCVITAHSDEKGLDRLQDELLLQTYQQPIEKLYFVSNMHVRLIDNFYVCPNRDDWGHEKRAMGLFLAHGDWICFMNADDNYDRRFLEIMVKATDDSVDLVACDFTSHLFGGAVRQTKPTLQSITSGNFLVRRSLAQKVGYNHRVYESDGLFIQDLMEAGARFRRIPQVLYFHR